MTLAAGLGPAVQVEARRAALQALSPLPQVDVTRPTAQAVFVTRTPAPATRGVASLTNHGVGVAKVTDRERERGHQFSLLVSAEEKENAILCVCVFFNLSEQVSTQLLPCLKNPDLQSTHCKL